MKILHIVFVLCIGANFALGDLCTCGRKYPPPPPKQIQVTYLGEACECGRPLPYHVEQPVPPPVGKLNNYGFQVYRPPQPKPVVLYNYDAHIEIPVNPNPCPPIEGLVAQVDKVVLPRPDCDEPVPDTCNCRKCKPIVEKHGLRERAWPQGCATSDPNPYDFVDENVYSHPIDYISRYDQHNMNPSDIDRSKRGTDVEANDEVDLKPNLNSRRMSSIWGTLLLFRSMKPSDDNDQEKTFEIRKINVNQETPWFKKSAINSEDIETSDIQFRSKRSVNFMNIPDKQMKISKKIVKNTKKVQKQKRSTVYVDEDSHLDDHDNHEVCQTIKKLRKRNDIDNQKAEVLQYIPEIQPDTVIDDSNFEQPSCVTCGKNYNPTGGCSSCGTCPSCLACGCTPVVTPVQHRPQYIEYSPQGYAMMYVPRTLGPNYLNHQTNIGGGHPRFIYDHHGHKYLENNGNLRILPPDYVSEEPNSYENNNNEEFYYNKIRDILYSHPEFHRWNTENRGSGELVPSALTQQRGFIQFLRDVVKNRYNDASHIPKTMSIEKKYVDTYDSHHEPNYQENEENDGEYMENTKKNKMEKKHRKSKKRSNHGKEMYTTEKGYLKSYDDNKFSVENTTPMSSPSHHHPKSEKSSKSKSKKTYSILQNLSDHRDN